MTRLDAHIQENTTTSFTETFVDRGADMPRPPIPSFASDVNIPNDQDQDEDDILSSPGLLGLPQTISPSSRPRPLPVRKERHLDSREVPPIIPPHHRHRTLVLCFDGTGDQFDADNSNIVQLFSLLKKDDSSKQMVYYQAGIGTYTSPQIVGPIMSKITQTLDAAIALNLDAHLMSGYEFLMQNYAPGDRICIFGFSRGAYTARGLAGMLHKVGLLPPSNFQQVPFAYKMYTRTDEVGWRQSNLFKKTFSRDVEIEFVGVWDTVDSVGIIPKRLPFTTSNTIVRTFRHALSLDERRAKFKANLWNRPIGNEADLGTTPRPRSIQLSEESDHEEEKPRLSRHSSSERDRSRPTFGWVSEDDQMQSSFEEHFASKHALNTPTDVEEVWFAGCHCDVGGGSVKNFTRHSLARISLRWMVRECFKTKTGIMFDSNRLRKIGLDPSSLYPMVLPRPAPIAVDKDTRIRTIPPEDPSKAPGLIKQLASRIGDSLPNFRSKLQAPKIKVSRPFKMEKRREKMKEGTIEDEEPESDGIMGGIKKRLRRMTTSSDHMVKHIIKSPPPRPPKEVMAEDAHFGSLTEEQEDLHDAMSPKYDQLKLSRSWWLLEYIPMQFRYQRGDNYWVTTFCANRARPRHIPRQDSEGVKVHRTVRMRMETTHETLKNGQHKRYEPKAPLRPEKIIWVD
ncbi:hypothetical protein K435DRAFT_841466 [Dendrothele bispora CBS 962.96]|uniref:T6SS Phospholipase effector Tle1-like catalytic domain-containing protein n=1 Tax=Dendrothele bispora (strain CBS 962.96) TaxID=1314807 RepID=A0A4S8LMU6_DENBC|nr:hypothetical protein K435DRAFT_841466 [Dendrothele bispora CBS 962.96]